MSTEPLATNLASGGGASSSAAPRQRLELNSGWDFVRRRMGRAWLSAAVRGNIELPHSWNERDTFQPGVRYYRGWGSYRNTLTAEFPAGGRWRLRSGGFFGRGDVWIDGRRIARVRGQFLGIDLDVSTHLIPGHTHVIGIRLENRHHRNELPGIREPDFLLHGGLSADLWLERVPDIRIDESALRVVTLPTGGGGWTVEVGLGVVNVSAEPGRVSARVSVIDPSGAVAVPGCEQEVRVDAGAPAEASVTLNAPSPAPWSPEDPHLYILRVELTGNGGLLDRYDQKIGFRHAEFRPGEGFHLNGQRLELRGINRHESMPGMGSALPEAMQREDARLIRAAGLNFVRLSHYPQQSAFLDACDEAGILVYAELASWKTVRTGGWLRSAMEQWTGMIRRDRNRPCVIVWGMGNESRSRKAYEALAARARELDGTRAVTYAENHMYRARREGTIGLPDVWGVNYELGELDAGVAASRLRNVIVTECSNYPPACRGDLREEWAQCELIERDLAQFRARRDVAGFALWGFADYATLRKRRYLRCCGVVDAWRLPKMSVELLRAIAGERPVLSLFMDAGERGPSERELYVITNCESVTLTRNDRPLGVLQGGRLHRLSVPFEPGVLRAGGRSPLGPAEARLESWGEGARLSASIRILPPGDSSGVLCVDVVVLDRGGREVRSWSGEARASCEGPARFCFAGGTETVLIRGGRGTLHARTAGRGRVAVRLDADGLETAHAGVFLRPEAQ